MSAFAVAAGALRHSALAQALEEQRAADREEYRRAIIALPDDLAWGACMHCAGAKRLVRDGVLVDCWRCQGTGKAVRRVG